MRTRTFARILASAIFATATLGVGHAQLRVPKAALTPVVETDPVRAGDAARIRLEVELDESLHVQSDEPRDELLIATVLTLTPPEGIAVEEIIYPPAEDLEQAGSDEPLAVFPHRFTIDVRLSVHSSIAPGKISVPGRLRYQACDEQMCYPPTSGETSWSLTVTRR